MTPRKGRPRPAPIARPAPQPWVWSEHRQEHTITLSTGGWISVHRHIDAPGVWHVSAHFIRIDRRPLESETIEGARVEALRVVSEVIEALRKELVRCRA